MKNKIFSLFVGSLMVLSLASCGQEETFGHHFSESYSFNEEKHWKVCEDEGCGQKSETGLHTYGDWQVIADSTCSQQGTKSRQCTVCGYTQTEAIELKDHNLADGWQTDEAAHWHKCLNDSSEKVDYQEHVFRWDYSKAGEKPSSCEEDGYGHKICEICNYELPSEVIKSTGHNWSLDPVIPSTYATCDSDGVIYYRCENCGANKSEVVPGGHSWGKPEYTWSEDLTECTAIARCIHNESHTVSETVSVTKTRLAPTCTANGLETYTTNAFTNSLFTEQVKNIEIRTCSDTLVHYGIPVKYNGAHSYNECSLCHKKYDEKDLQAPWLHAEDLFWAGSKVTRDGDLYVLPSSGTTDRAANGLWIGVQNGVVAKELTRRYLCIDMTSKGGSEWGGKSSDLYHIGNGVQNGIYTEVFKGRSSYTTTVDWHQPVTQLTVYNPETNTPFNEGNITKYDVRVEWVFDLSCMEDFGNILLMSDSGVKLQINSITFKDSICGHLTEDYEYHSSVYDGEYSATATWMQCPVCGFKADVNETVPAKKVALDVSNYALKNDALTLEGNTIKSEDADGHGRYITYNIPAEFVGKATLVVKLKLSSAPKGFDIRLGNVSGDGNGQYASNFGQTDTVGSPLNRGYEFATVVNEKGESTYVDPTSLYGCYVTFTFDLSHSAVKSAVTLSLGLWWLTQTLEINQAYFVRP